MPCMSRDQRVQLAEAWRPLVLVAPFVAPHRTFGHLVVRVPRTAGSTDPSAVCGLFSCYFRAFIFTVRKPYPKPGTSASRSTGRRGVPR